ncbi:hypothetical protein BSKO_08403 [Bryopsis sp. KO-2023]|nr:hypothetical protein BSKO_08403 [Bryopsis sp. KO-2023]
MATRGEPGEADVQGGITLFSARKRKKNVAVDTERKKRKGTGGVDAESPPADSKREESGVPALLATKGDDDGGEEGNEVGEGSNEITEAKKKLAEGVFPDEEVGFTDVGLSEWLAKTCRTLGMKRPTAIQCGCVPQILAGRNVIGVAQTGSGKTAAFALPTLQILGEDPYGVFTLLLTPTRELANQVGEQFRALGAGMSIRVCVVVGGLDSHAQALQVAKRPHVVVATPGRLATLFENDTQLSGAFSRVRFLILDEADRLLDVAFEKDLRRALKPLPMERQTLLFSATMTKSLIKLQKATLKDAYIYQAYEGLKASATLEQQYVFIPKKVRDVYLYHILDRLENLGVRSAMIFCSTCQCCKTLKCLLDELGFESVAIHSQMMQKMRFESLERFKSGRVSMLVATDVASRGLDIPTVDLVVNYELPIAPRDYVHRVGRTARAGRFGRSVSFITQYDVELLHKIEELVDAKLSEFEVDEELALKGMNKVYIARKAALLNLAKEETFAKHKKKKDREKTTRGGKRGRG